MWHKEWNKFDKTGIFESILDKSYKMLSPIEEKEKKIQVASDLKSYILICDLLCFPPFIFMLK